MASGQEEVIPRLRMTVKIAPIGIQAIRYMASRCRFSRIGCTSVGNSDTAQESSAVDNEPLSALLVLFGFVFEASENRSKA